MSFQVGRLPAVRLRVRSSRTDESAQRPIRVPHRVRPLAIVGIGGNSAAGIRVRPMVRDGQNKRIKRPTRRVQRIHLGQGLVEDRFVRHAPRRAEFTGRIVLLLDDAFHAVVPHVRAHSIEHCAAAVDEFRGIASRAEQGLSKISSQRNEAVRQTKLGDATRQKIPEIAVDHYRQALIADPQYASAHYGLYQLYNTKKGGDPEKAVNSAVSFLEAADDAHPQRKEVETTLTKLKGKVGKEKKK